MADELVSVVIPVFNVERWLRRCLESAVGQTHRNLDIVCVDDATPDESCAILAQFSATDSRVRVIHHPENAGLGPARTTGTSVAAGEYILFLDGDDRMPLDAVERLLGYALRFDADVVKGASSWEFPDGRIEPRRPFVQGDGGFELLPGIEVFERMLGVRPSPYIPISMWGTLIRTRLFREHGIIHPATYQEDVGTTPFLMAVAERVVLASDVVLYYYQREGSEMRRPYDRRRLESYRALHRHMRDTLIRLHLYEQYRLPFAIRFSWVMTGHFATVTPEPAVIPAYAALMREVLREGFGEPAEAERAAAKLFPLLKRVRKALVAAGLGDQFPIVADAVLPPAALAEFYQARLRGPRRAAHSRRCLPRARDRPEHLSGRR